MTDYLYAVDNAITVAGHSLSLGDARCIAAPQYTLVLKVLDEIPQPKTERVMDER